MKTTITAAQRLALVTSLSVTTILTATMSSVHAATSYTFEDHSVPGDNFTQLFGINNSSAIVGVHGAIVNQGVNLTLPNTFTTENFPGAAQTQVVGINNTGSTDGFYVDNGGNTHGFIKNKGTFTTIDAPNTAFNQLLSINDSGQASGYSSIDAGGQILQRSYTEKNGTFTYLDNLLPAGTQNNQATGVNNSGTVAGFYVDASNINHGYLISGTTFTTLDVPGSTFTQALGLNNLGQVVGQFNDAAGNAHGFIDTNGQFQTIDFPNGLSTAVNGINDKGQIVGFFASQVTDSTNGFVGNAAVPEPSNVLGALAILGLGTGIKHKLSKKKTKTNLG